MTVDREYLELMQADLDGELDGPARAELARYLLAHPEARAEQAALARVCDALGRVRAEDPPADLTRRILAALPPTHRGMPAMTGRGGALRAFVGRPMAVRFAAGLAGAALVATLAYQLGSSRDPLSSSDLVGTMVQADRQDGQAADVGPTWDEARVDVGRFSAVVALHGEPTAPRVSLSVQSGAGLEVIARAGGQQVHLNGSAQSSPGLLVAGFRPLAQPGTDAVEIEIVELASGAVLQRTTLWFRKQR